MMGYMVARRGGLGQVVARCSQMMWEACRAKTEQCLVNWRPFGKAADHFSHPGLGRPRLPISMQCRRGTSPSCLAASIRGAYLVVFRECADEMLGSNGQVSSTKSMEQSGWRTTMSGRHAVSQWNGRRYVEPGRSTRTEAAGYFAEMCGAI